MQQNQTKANTEARREAFLKALGEGRVGVGWVPVAAAAAGVHRCTPYRWARRDAAFRQRWDAIFRRQVEEQARAYFEAEARRRAQRNAELRPLRVRQAAHARAAKRRG